MNKSAAIPAALLLAASLGASFSSCDEHDNVGNTITKGEVTIVVDSLFTVTGRSVPAQNLSSRQSDLLIGRLFAEDYGELNASFTGRLMPSSQLSIPDSIPLEDVDGMTLRFTFKSNGFTGDSLAPQQLSVFALTKQLPDNIDNTFDPEGYYDPQKVLGSTSYTASGLGMKSSGSSSTGIDGTANTNNNQVQVGYVNVPLNATFARDVVAQYRKDASVFQWPETFAQYFPGILVRSTFGRGLVLNFTNSEFLTHWHYKSKITRVENGVSVTRDTILCDTTSLFSISPEVLSANLLRLLPAPSIKNRIEQGEYIIQSPAGYNVEIDFPAQSILDRYMNDDFNLGVINTLTYTLPVTTPANNYGITAPPYLLMIKSSKLQEFFSQSKVPGTDDTDAFWAAYDAETGQYNFSNMRPYIVSLLKAGKPVDEADTKFTLVPVSIATEKVGYPGNEKTIVTKCTPYIAHPSLCVADLSRSKVKFTYSRQVIR